MKKYERAHNKKKKDEQLEKPIIDALELRLSLIELAKFLGKLANQKILSIFYWEISPISISLYLT